MRAILSIPLWHGKGPSQNYLMPIKTNSVRLGGGGGGGQNYQGALFVL